MSTWGIVPVKRLSEAKSSLSSVLDTETRKELVLAMLDDVMRTLLSSPSVAGVIVVSPDAHVLEFAGKHGAECVRDDSAELNKALTMGVERAVQLKASSVLIIPGDVPLVRPHDVENIIAMAVGRREVVISPSKKNGTDALLLKPPKVMELRFGGESFPLHLQEAHRAGIMPRIYRSSNLANDLDDPEDIDAIIAEGDGTRTHQVLTRVRANPYLTRK
ncbi:MAG: 2-phospho-L-lactate guanylyltransferase [Candidatus Hadarchaeales archaeon]